MIYQKDKCEIFLNMELRGTVSEEVADEIMNLLKDKPKEMWDLAIILQAVRLGRRPMLTEEYIVNLAHKLKEGKPLRP